MSVISLSQAACIACNHYPAVPDGLLCVLCQDGDDTQQDVVTDATPEELRDLLREVLTVLHKTNVSKRDLATRIRAALGMRPGERVSSRGMGTEVYRRTGW